MTKEELLTDHGRLLAKNTELVSGDGLLRKRFAKVLNQTEKSEYSPYRTTASDLSWEEIFCEIGKLMAFRDLRSWKDDIEFRIQRLTPDTKVE